MLKFFFNFTEFRSVATVDVEGEIAASVASGQISEDHAVRAQLLRQVEVAAFVVAIALDGIGEQAVLLRTTILLAVDDCDTK